MDIRIGNRTVAVQLKSEIWPEMKAAHNDFNHVCGEIIIDDPTGSFFPTINNKTNINLLDPSWIELFKLLKPFEPKRRTRTPKESEEMLVDEFVANVNNVTTEERPLRETHIWYSGARIDLLRTEDPKDKKNVTIYEFKVGKGAPIHLYQLKMYWDGLVFTHKELVPVKAILRCESYSANLVKMKDTLNQQAPSSNHPKYNFEIQTHPKKK